MTRKGHPTVKKRKGVKTQTLVIPDSDEESSPSSPSNIDSDYTRLVMTHVKTSGLVMTVTTSSIPLTEVVDTTDNPTQEVDAGFAGDPTLEDAAPTTQVATRKQTKANDSVSPTKYLTLSSLTNGPTDQDEIMA